MRPVYLDCAASTPCDPRVVELMHHHLTVEFGNQGSRTHVYGRRARQSVEHARSQIASVVAARRSEVIFTSGATEACNLALLGSVDFSTPGHIVTTQIEHPAVMEPIAEMERRGFEVTRVAPSVSGSVETRAILEALREETLLVSVMHVNNETGAIQPVAEIADALAPFAARFHVDASQGFGKLIAPLQHPRIDLISVSAHKIGGPQGVGALIARKRGGMMLRPLMFGGGQEGGFRPGTLPAHLIAGFGLAAELAAQHCLERWNSAKAFRDRVLRGLAPAGFVLHGDRFSSSPYVVNLSFPGFDGEEVIEAWGDLAAVSNGSACASNKIHCSHVLHAMGVEADLAAGAVRLSWYAVREEPDFEAMVKALAFLAVKANG